MTSSTSVDDDQPTASPFRGDRLYLVGLDVLSESPGEQHQVNDFYDDVHAPEVLRANTGFVSFQRYERLLGDARGIETPQLLTAYQIADGDGERQYLDDSANGRLTYSARASVWPDLIRTRWRFLLRKVSEAGHCAHPSVIFLVGITPASGSNQDEVEEFNDFYTRIHVPEVMETLGFESATRWEVSTAIQHPTPGAPQYVAAYEVGGDRARELISRPTPFSATAAASSATVGPPAWENRWTSWRVQYSAVPVRTEAAAVKEQETAR